MTDAITGYGSEFWLANALDVLTEMGELIALEPGSDEWGTTEATHFKSAGRRREYIKTLIDGGQGNFQLNWLPGGATDVVISAAHLSAEAKAYKVVFPSSTGTWESEGEVLVVSRTPTVPLDDRMTCQVTLQFTGAKVEAAGGA